MYIEKINKKLVFWQKTLLSLGYKNKKSKVGNLVFNKTAPHLRGCFWFLY
jgi:hypothetical protein